MLYRARSLSGAGAWTIVAMLIPVGCGQAGAGSTRDTTRASSVAAADTTKQVKNAPLKHLRAALDGTFVFANEVLTRIHRYVVPRDTTVRADSIRQPRAPLVPRPAAVRGLYVNRWAALGQKMWQLIDVARRTEVNALVLDVKDDRGLVF